MSSGFNALAPGGANDRPGNPARFCRQSGLAAFVAFALIASGCSIGEAGITVAEPDPSATASLNPTSSANMPVDPEATFRAVPDDHYWPDDPQQLEEDLNGCEASPFSLVECNFLLWLLMATDGVFWEPIASGVDLLGAGYAACRAMDAKPDPADVAEWLPVPDEWPSPDETDWLVAIVAAYASFMLCPQHQEIGAELM